MFSFLENSHRASQLDSPGSGGLLVCCKVKSPTIAKEKKKKNLPYPELVLHRFLEQHPIAARCAPWHLGISKNPQPPPHCTFLFRTWDPRSWRKKLPLGPVGQGRATSITNIDGGFFFSWGDAGQEAWQEKERGKLPNLRYLPTQYLP